MSTPRSLIQRWRARRAAHRALLGLVEELRARLVEAERKLAIASGHMVRQQVALISHARELKAIARTLEATPTLRGRFAHHRKAVLEAAVEAAAEAERAAGGSKSLVEIAAATASEGEATEARG